MGRKGILVTYSRPQVQHCQNTRPPSRRSLTNTSTLPQVQDGLSSVTGMLPSSIVLCLLLAAVLLTPHGTIVLYLAPVIATAHEWGMMFAEAALTVSFLLIPAQDKTTCTLLRRHRSASSCPPELRFWELQLTACDDRQAVHRRPRLEPLGDVAVRDFIHAPGIVDGLHVIAAHAALSLIEHAQHPAAIGCAGGMIVQPILLRDSHQVTNLILCHPSLSSSWPQSSRCGLPLNPRIFAVLLQSPERSWTLPPRAAHILQ